MPDVTPKTESGRTPNEYLPSVLAFEREMWPDGPAHGVGSGIWAKHRDRIMAEAASAAVAEVLDAAEAVIEWLGPCDHFDHHGNCQTHGVEKPCRVETLRALIASERGT